MAEGDPVKGAVLRTPGGTYFIPESDLQSYRLPDDVAAELDDSEVEGFGQLPEDYRGWTSAQFAPMEWNLTIRPDIKRIMLHTATRL